MTIDQTYSLRTPLVKALASSLVSIAHLIIHPKSIIELKCASYDIICNTTSFRLKWLNSSCCLDSLTLTEICREKRWTKSFYTTFREKRVYRSVNLSRAAGLDPGFRLVWWSGRVGTKIRNAEFFSRLKKNDKKLLEAGFKP